MKNPKYEMMLVAVLFVAFLVLLAAPGGPEAKEFLISPSDFFSTQ